MEEKLLSAISTVGFPIVVSCYLLVKFQTTHLLRSHAPLPSPPP
ncbi:MAG: YvrJ family protein [Anaerovibrio sp.]